MANPTDLAPGDRIEIRYRARDSTHASSNELRDRWIAAEVKHIDSDTWPLAQLADGQLTEVRRYMEWRYASRYARPSQARAPQA